ncbi:ABC transporter permease, partial [Bacillus thuringiensis]|nr:ABC transporter permease [Bacillus thuringiensis]
YKGNKAVFQIGNETKQLKIQGANDVAMTNLGELVVVVSDEMYEQAKQAFGTRVVKNIDVKNEKDSKVLTEKLTRVMPAGESEMVPS